MTVSFYAGPGRRNGVTEREIFVVVRFVIVVPFEGSPVTDARRLPVTE
jgi:hypothetical protein